MEELREMDGEPVWVERLSQREMSRLWTAERIVSELLYENQNRVLPQKVIFHPPATIVYWTDGTKTVVKCDARDEFNKETGLALCYMKKMLGSSRKLNDVLHKWCGD